MAGVRSHEEEDDDWLGSPFFKQKGGVDYINSRIRDFIDILKILSRSYKEAAKGADEITEKVALRHLAKECKKLIKGWREYLERDVNWLNPRFSTSHGTLELFNALNEQLHSEESELQHSLADVGLESLRLKMLEWISILENFGKDY